MERAARGRRALLATAVYCHPMPHPAPVTKCKPALTRASQFLAAVLADLWLSTVFISKLHETIPAARNRNAGACHSLPYKCLRASSLVNSSSSTMPGSRLW